ncbi:MAG TPA: hypothetical protein VHQ23_07775 [Ilumatobacteraceae bacterium]|nr:hypothetical protein [Ilumatobacteraceae bacterium]
MTCEPRCDKGDGAPAAGGVSHTRVVESALQVGAATTSSLSITWPWGIWRASERAEVSLWTYSSPELFDLLVRRRHWSLRRYSRFVVEAIQNALLPLEITH